MTFETFDQSDEKAWCDQQKDNDDNDENDDNDDDNDDDEFDDDDDGIDYQPWHALYLGHFLPRDTLSNNHCPVPLMEIMMMMKILTMFTMMIVIINSW